MTKILRISSFCALACCILMYTSCQKTQVTKASGIDQEKLAIQVASGFYNSLTGGNGNRSVNNPATVSINGKAVNSNSMCDYVIDSAINYTTNIGDTIRSVSTGHFNYKYLCDDSKWSAIGYLLTDSTHTAGTAPGYDFLNIVNQNYKATVTSPGNYGSVEVNGSQKSTYSVTSKKASIESSYQLNQFKLRNVVVLRAYAPDIVAGEADFVVTGNIDNEKYTFSGLMQFFTKHVAITMNGRSFRLNLETGEITYYR